MKEDLYQENNWLYFSGGSDSGSALHSCHDILGEGTI